jgi:ABC-type sugar transport system ATPase subunit
VANGRISETNHDDLVGKMVGRHIAHAPERVVQHDKRHELLRAEGLSRKGVLQDINLSLFQGEVLGIAGLRGAGRTELVRAIFGADPDLAANYTCAGICAHQSAMNNGKRISIPEFE